MNSFTQIASWQESSGNDRSLFRGWPQRNACSAESGLAANESGDDERNALDSRLALLARAIEQEIIPRLMLAHRSPNDCCSPAAVPLRQVSQASGGQ